MISRRHLYLLPGHGPMASFTRCTLALTGGMVVAVGKTMRALHAARLAWHCASKANKNVMPNSHFLACRSLLATLNHDAMPAKLSLNLHPLRLVHRAGLKLIGGLFKLLIKTSLDLPTQQTTCVVVNQ